MDSQTAQAKKTYSRFGGSYLVLYLIFIAAILILFLGCRLITGGIEIGGAASAYLEFGLRVLIIYPLMVLSVRKLPRFETGRNRLGFGGLLACICITYSLMYLSNMIGIVLNAAIGRLTGQGGVTPIVDLFTSVPPAGLVVIAAILAPVWEEILFRKVLLDRIAGYGEVTAMLLSGFMFGLYHANLSQFVYAFTIGCFFAFIYLRTGNILYTILLHAVINGTSTYLTTDMLMRNIDVAEMIGYLNSGDMEGYNRFIQDNIAAMAGIALFGMFVIIVMIVGIILMIALRKKFVFAHHPGEIEKGKRFATAIGNPGMLLYVIFFLCYMVMVQLGKNPFSILAQILGL